MVNGEIMATSTGGQVGQAEKCGILLNFIFHGGSYNFGDLMAENDERSTLAILVNVSFSAKIPAIQ